MTWPWQDYGSSFSEVVVRRARPEFVRQVIVGGRTVLHDGQFTEVDRASILDEINMQLRGPASSDELDRLALSEAVLPYVADFYRGN
jgi:hypothetical protein